MKVFRQHVGAEVKSEICHCHEQYLKRIFVKSKVIAFEMKLQCYIKKKQLRNKSLGILEIYGDKARKGHFRRF